MCSSDLVRITLKTTGTNLHKSDTTAMVRVHIRMDLENKAGEIILTKEKNKDTSTK